MESELLKRNFFLQLKEVITVKYSFLLAKAQTILSNHLILIAYLIIRSDIENLWSFMRLQCLPKFCNYSSHLFLSQNDHNKWTHWLHSPEISLTWKFFCSSYAFKTCHMENLCRIRFHLRHGIIINTDVSLFIIKAKHTSK